MSQHCPAPQRPSACLLRVSLFRSTHPNSHSFSTQRVLGARHSAPLFTSAMGKLGLRPLYARCWPVTTYTPTSACPAGLSPGLLHGHKTLFPSKSYCLPKAFLIPTESQPSSPETCLVCTTQLSGLVYIQFFLCSLERVQLCLVLVSGNDAVLILTTPLRRQSGKVSSFTISK